jgi:predicted regulator of Ras-like GTPase activity (Roadblock/LC7/MglB family)
MTYETPQSHSTPVAASMHEEARQQMGGMLEEFVETVPGVTHALLVSRDGLRLVDSNVHRDAADRWAATLGSLASLCESIPGPRGDRGGLKLALVERDDALIFASIAGSSAVFPNQPGSVSGSVATVLAVIAGPETNAGTVGFEMGRLVDRFAPYMVESVRSA